MAVSNIYHGDQHYKIISSMSRTKAFDDFPVVPQFILNNEAHPYIMSSGDIIVSYDSFFKDLMEKFPSSKILFTKQILQKDGKIEPIKTILEIKYNLYIDIILDREDCRFYDSTSIDMLLNQLENFKKSDDVRIGYFNILYGESTDKKLIIELVDLAKKNRVVKDESVNKIGMLCSESGDFYMKDFILEKNYDLIEPDLHYGEGFLDFHNQLIYRFEANKKGLVLFHGEPGTGKTYYIRHLMKELSKRNKYLIYVPSSLIESMFDSSIINFISTFVMEKQKEGINCVLLLEDAEQLLVSRKGDERTLGISNLLNITDGILNDLLHIQVIATFNTNISNIDEALTRPERLIARKNFKKLSKEKTKELVDFLKIDISVNSGMTLAEIYSRLSLNQPLLHDQDSTRDSIGFKRGY